MVPAARYGASGANAVSAARCALLMHAIAGETAQIWARARAIARPGQGRFTEELRGRSRSKRREKRGGGDAAGEGLGTWPNRCGSDRAGPRGFALTAYPAWRAGTRDLEAFGRVITSDQGPFSLFASLLKRQLVLSWYGLKLKERREPF
jgi:hypothetical protein